MAVDFVFGGSSSVLKVGILGWLRGREKVESDVGSWTVYIYICRNVRYVHVRYIKYIYLQIKTKIR